MGLKRIYNEGTCTGQLRTHRPLSNATMPLINLLPSGRLSLLLGILLLLPAVLVVNGCSSSSDKSGKVVTIKELHDHEGDYNQKEINVKALVVDWFSDPKSHNKQAVLAEDGRKYVERKASMGSVSDMTLNLYPLPADVKLFDEVETTGKYDSATSTLTATHSKVVAHHPEPMQDTQKPVPGGP